jgi:hypothetical protein
VIVLKGSAILQFEDEPATWALGPGDYILIVLNDICFGGKADIVRMRLNVSY